MGNEKEPAAAGGRPVRDELLPFARAEVSTEDEKTVLQAIREGRLEEEPWVGWLEKTLASYAGRRHAVAVSSGTAAVHLALAAAGIGLKEEVVLSPLAPPHASTCVLHMGAVPIFADVDRETLNLDPASVEEVITERTRAVIPYHYAGRPCEMDAFLALAQKHGLTVIEDATMALGAEYGGQKAGSFGDLSVFSFHPRQGVCTGEGGAVLTDREELAIWLRLYRDQGMVRDADKLAEKAGLWHEELQERGYNYRMSGLTAALGHSQMTCVEKFLRRREEIAARYDAQLGEIDLVELPGRSPRARSARYLYPVLLKLDRLKADRAGIFNALLAENIEAGVHYLPVFRHPYQRWIGHPEFCHLEDPFAVTEEAYLRLISLPLYPAMSDNDVACVINAFRHVLARYAR